jgi:hypothetical protein
MKIQANFVEVLVVEESDGYVSFRTFLFAFFLDLLPARKKHAREHHAP